MYITTEELPCPLVLEYITGEAGQELKYVDQGNIMYGENTIELIQGTSSIPDYVVYDDKNIEEDKVPTMLIEYTKNNPNESGNMIYQRLVKFVYFDQLYPGNNTEKVYMFDFPIAPKRETKTWEIGYRMARTLKVKVELYGDVKKVLKEHEEYKNLEELIESINGTKENKGHINNRVYETDGEIRIRSNLVKKLQGKETLSHDPNKGFVAATVACIRKFSDKKIKIESPKITQKMVDSCNKNNKFWHCVNGYENVTLGEFHSSRSTLPREYLKRSKSEKNVSIIAHILAKEKGYDILFHNHAGCEKSYITVPGHPPVVFKKRNQYSNNLKWGIPDFVYKAGKTVYIVEAEKSENYETGLKQLETFETFESEIKDMLPETEIKRCVILYGEHKEGSEFTVDDKTNKVVYNGLTL
jgi:hypothetical protein